MPLYIDDQIIYSGFNHIGKCRPSVFETENIYDIVIFAQVLNRNLSQNIINESCKICAENYRIFI